MVEAKGCFRISLKIGIVMESYDRTPFVLCSFNLSSFDSSCIRKITKNVSEKILQIRRIFNSLSMGEGWVRAEVKVIQSPPQLLHRHRYRVQQYLSCHLYVLAHESKSRYYGSL